MFRRRLSWSVPSLGAVAVAALALAPGVRAGETQWWIADSPGDYAHAESRGIVVRPDGTLELGPRTRSFTAESLSVVWAVAPLADGSVALGGDHGRIARWTESGGVRPWIRLPVGQVLSLAANGNELVAGTGPEGCVYRIGARGDTTLLARTGERYVWGLVSGPGGTWYAATGTRGRLYRIGDGKPRLVTDTDESNLVSLIADRRGGVYAGGDSRGRVFHVAADGTTRTVLDAVEDEIRALTLGADGALYAAAVTGSAVAEEGEREGEGPAPVKAAVAGGHAVVYRIVPDSSVATWWTSPQPFIYGLAPAPGGGVVAATGNRAALYALDDANAATQWMAAPQGQITAVVTGPGGRIFAASSNPAMLWTFGPGSAESGVLLSPALDARRMARFGHLRTRGDRGGAALELDARSGNSDPPDTTWSAWSHEKLVDDAAQVTAPGARYLQWRLTLRGGTPKISAVEASWREVNLPPRVEDVTIAPQAQAFVAGEIQPRIEPVTQSLPGGQKVEYTLPPAQTVRQLRDLPMFARGLRTIGWHASDPNGDPLHYRVEVRREDGGPWIKLTSDLDVPTWTLDTASLPDGRYRVRITARDEQANPLGEDLSAAALSPPFTVDNTPPAVSALDGRGEPGAIRIEGKAEDAASAISRIEVAVDEGDWRPVTPDGGFADERALSFHARLDDVAAGEHVVGVRAVDMAGNAVTRSIRVTVPRAR